MATLFQSLTASNTLFEEANAYFDKGRFAEARKRYQKAFMLRPSGRTAYGMAIAHEALGENDKAMHYYADALRLEPRNLEARVNLGNLLRGDGRNDAALHHHLMAFAREPAHGLTLYNAAATQQARRRDAEARWLLEASVAATPDFKLARAALAASAPVRRAPASQLDEADRAEVEAALRDSGNGDHAAACARYAGLAARLPDNAVIAVDYGNARLALRETDAAIDLQRKAIRIDPWLGPAHHNLGAALQEAGRHAEAIDAYYSSISFNPTLAASWLNLGRAYGEAGDLLKAWDAFHVAGDLPDASPETLIELAAVSRLLRRSDEAIDAMKRLDVLWPEHFTVANNLGAFLLDENRLDEALASFEKAARLNPAAAISFMNSGAVYELRGQYDRALAAYRKALELEPHHASLLTRAVHMAQHQCEWDGIEDMFRRVGDAVGKGDLAGVHPFGLLAIPGITLAGHLACSRHFAKENYANLRKIELPRRPLAVQPGAKIKIGYLSCDLYDHATAWLIAEIIEFHDRGRFEVIAFSYGPNYEGPTRTRLKKSFDHFVDLDKTSDEQAATIIRSYGIDVLVDLKGYTQGTRSGILAMRPAPLQVNYLGYPGSLGADYVDWIVADSIVIPPGLAHGYDEKVLRLPACYQPNDRKRPLPAVPARRAVGLPETGIVFCVFNNVYKITPDVFDIWCRLLRDNSGSVLWILMGTAGANANLVKEAAKRGVGAERLVFAPRMKLEGHMERFRAADVFLDAFPCTAHTTASDALWCGVPVVTCMGDGFASRVAGSILAAAGLPDLVARDFDEYHAIAQRIVSEKGRLKALKQHLEAERFNVPLFDSASYAAAYEKLLVEMVDAGRGTLRLREA